MDIEKKLTDIWDRLDEHSGILNMLYNPVVKNGLFVDLKKSFDNHLAHHWAVDIGLILTIFGLLAKILFFK